MPGASPLGKPEPRKALPAAVKAMILTFGWLYRVSTRPSERGEADVEDELATAGSGRVVGAVATRLGGGKRG